MNNDNNQIPSTSRGLDEMILNVDDENLNQSLENFAKNYNLSAQNVKNIIFHVVRNPQTFSTLIENNLEVTNNIRLTRSRLKVLEKISNVKLGIELKPVNLGKTFLDVDYAEDDDEDEDYQPDKDELGFPDENDPEWRQLVLSPALIEDEFIDSAIEDEPMDRVSNENGFPPQLLTNVDDPVYLDFVNSCLGGSGQEFLFNEEEDEEYNILNQREYEEPEEYRMDRSTKIPKWEIKALREDLIDTAQQPNLNSSTTKTGTLQKEILSTKQVSETFIDSISLSKNNIVNESSKIPEIFNTLVKDIFTTTKKIKTFIRGSLLNEIVQFSQEERKILKIQMEQHVQLLTQTIVGTYGDEALVFIRNNAINMLSDLDKEYNIVEKKETSSFNISNLPDGIYSCHDILACEGVDLPSTSTPFMADYVNTHFITGFSEFQAMKNEIMWVLSQSGALKYPQLVPKLRFAIFPKPCSTFFQSEQLLLAISLNALKNIKHSSWRNSNGKYHLIAKHYLPARSITQIRNHLKNIRSSTAVFNPINEIVCQAEKGLFKGTFVLNSQARSAQYQIPINWPENLQTEWLKNISKWFKQGAIQVVLKTNTMATTDLTFEQVMPITNNEIGEQHKKLIESTVYEGNSNDQFSDLLFEVDEFSDTLNASTQQQHLLNPAKQQKSRTRKFRVKRGIEKLCDAKARAKTLNALVEAINCDFKQRFFMHQDKLKELQLIISNGELNIQQIFDELNQKLGNQHPQILALFSALVSDKELSPSSSNSSIAQRKAYQKAFDMIINIQTYLSGCSSTTGIRNAFKNIKDVCEKAFSEDLFNRIKSHFAVRDEPLWRLLKTQIANEKFNEKVEDWEYEFIDMDKIDKENKEGYHNLLNYEQICLPYRFESTERGRLRLRRGRVTMEHNGKLKTVNIGFTTDHRDGNASTQQSTAAPFTRDDDKALLMSFKKHNGNPQKTIKEFLTAVDKKTNVSALEATRRLEFLMNILKRVQHSTTATAFET